MAPAPSGEGEGEFGRSSSQLCSPSRLLGVGRHRHSKRRPAMRALGPQSAQGRQSASGPQSVQEQHWCAAYLHRRHRRAPVQARQHLCTLRLCSFDSPWHRSYFSRLNVESQSAALCRGGASWVALSGPTFDHLHSPANSISERPRPATSRTGRLGYSPGRCPAQQRLASARGCLSRPDRRRHLGQR